MYYSAPCFWLKASPKGLVVCVVVADYDKLYLILNKPYLAHDMHEMQFQKKMQFTWIVHVVVCLLARLVRWILEKRAETRVIFIIDKGY